MCMKSSCKLDSFFGRRNLTCGSYAILKKVTQVAGEVGSRVFCPLLMYRTYATPRFLDLANHMNTVCEAEHPPELPRHRKIRRLIV